MVGRSDEVAFLRLDVALTDALEVPHPAASTTQRARGGTSRPVFIALPVTLVWFLPRTTVLIRYRVSHLRGADAVGFISS
jgi:hypothetical protein